MPIVTIGDTSRKTGPIDAGLSHPTDSGPRTPSEFGASARIGLGLLGGFSYMIEWGSIRKLARAVEANDANGLKAYLSGRSLTFMCLHPCIREHALGIFVRGYETAVKKIESRLKRTVSRLEGDDLTISRIGKKPGLGVLVNLLPPTFHSINEALLLADSYRTARATIGGQKSVNKPSGGVAVTVQFNIKVDDPTIGSVIKLALSEIVPVMIRARALEDLFATRGVYLSAEAFKKLVIPPQQVGDLLFGEAVKGILDLNDHLRQHVSGLTLLERAAIVSHYSSRKNPFVSFTNAVERLQTKIHRMRDTEGLKLTVAGESPSHFDRKSIRTERHRSISAMIIDSPLGDNLNERQLRPLARSIEKLCRKRGISLESLPELLREAESGADLVAALTNIGKPIPSEVKACKEERDELRLPPRSTATGDHAAQTDPYIDPQMRLNLRRTLDRGQADFNELKSLLLGHFGCHFSQSTAPGSHSEFIRRIEGASPSKAQISSRVRDGKIPLDVTIILKTLKDLKIDPGEFVDAFKISRGIY